LRKFIYIFSFIIIIFGCKRGASKLDLNDIESHRAYQDSLIYKEINSSGKLAVVKSLINEYLNLNYKNKETNSSYYYYLSRLYSSINSFPMDGVFYDSLNHKLSNLDVYKNFYDSSYYYSELALKYDPNNIRAMSVFSTTLFWEQERYKLFKSKGLLIPHTSLIDSKLWNSRVSYLCSNFSKFSNIDTSFNKSISRGIFEYAFTYVAEASNNLIKKGVNWNNNNDLYLLSYVGICMDLLNKYKLEEIDSNYYKIKSKELLPYVLKANETIKIAPIRDILDKTLYKRGWSSTEHSLDGDINTSNGNFIEYTNPSIDESEMLINLNSDFTYTIIFQPIRHVSKVTSRGKWKFRDNKIELDNDIFVKVPVTSADFPLSEDPFFEYILIPKTLQLFNGHLVIDERTTNRNTFFVQLAIVQQNSNINSDSYALKSLNDLSLDKELVSQYLGYFK
jgi:hypothetical protein